ncbi:hypothetical protein [Pseudomonas sp. MF6396]|uniref:hypothetical protein n=1 Tax=Pseudomonas sp. MF6396 TaxID=1960828 RepID=UPI000998CD96|nr:hypothetical protein [Pseudomonas sp. MF6396]OOW03037.1 hypothetical protein MF6396_11570 [Pseudomonas sp. MF6396]
MTQAFTRTVEQALRSRLQGCGYDTSDLELTVQQGEDKGRAVSVSRRWSLVTEVRRESASVGLRINSVSEHQLEQSMAEQRQVLLGRGAAHYKNRVLKGLGSNPAHFLRSQQVKLFALDPLYTSHTCGTCSGYGKQRCTACNGSCKLRCSSCSGKGRTQCWGCGGSGRTGSGSCAYCMGAGGDNCPSCVGGSVACGCMGGQVTCGGCLGDKFICTRYTLEVSAKAVGNSVHLKSNDTWLKPYVDEWGDEPETIERAAEGFAAPYYPDNTPEKGDLVLSVDGTCYYSQAQVRAGRRSIRCNMLGRYRHVVFDDGLAASYFDRVIEQLENPADIEQVALASERSVARRMIEESGHVNYVSQLSDVKNGTVSPEQANRFFALRKNASDQQTALRSKLEPRLVLRRALGYFWRLSLLMLVLFFFSAGKLLEVKFGGPQVLFRSDGPATVWAMFKHYLVLPFTSPINGVMLVGVGLLCTWLFKDMLWHRMNRFMGKGPGNRLLAAVVLAFCLMPLLALFPDTPIALLRDGPRLQHMLPNALVGMLGALPTLVPLSLLLALVFNRALNAPAIDARLRRMNFDV